MAWTREDIAVRVVDQNAEEIRSAIAAKFPDIRFVDKAADASGLKVLLGFRPPEDEPLSGYDWVHAAGAGVDHHRDALEGVDPLPIVTRTTGKMGQQIGEYCLAYSLEHLQKMRVREAMRLQRLWDKSRAAPAYVFDTHVAVLGTGAIGSGIAKTFKALGAHVSGYSRSGTPREGFDEVSTFDKLSGLGEADIVVLALPATPQTEGIVDDAVLKHLTGPLLINVGRGSTLDSLALKDALAGDRISRAVLDVFEEEPLKEDDWRWCHTRVMVTPHVSGLTRTADTIERFCELLDDYMQSGDPPASVDIRRGY